MTATETTHATGTTDASGHPAPDVREAALRPFARPGSGYWLLATFLTAIVLTGLAAWIEQLRQGLGAAGYNDAAFWSIYEANLVTFIGVSYGGAVISAILRLTGAHWRAPLTRIAEATAVVTVLVGGAFVVPHLGRPEQIWELVTRPNLSSPIFWDFVAITTYAVGSIVFFALPLVPDMSIMRQGHADRLGHRRRLYVAISRGWVAAPAQRRVLNGALGIIAIMIIPLAVSVHSVLSWAFALVSRPGWHESIWAPYFVVAALYSGVALVILVVAGFRRAYHLQAFITERHFVRLGFIMAAFSVAYIYLTFSDILPAAYVGEPDQSAVLRELLVGHLAVWFWIWVVAGGVLPLLLIALPWTRNTRGVVIAAAVVAPAMWLKRMLMVVDSSTYDRMTNQFGTFHFTWVSVAVTLAGVAAIPLLLMLLFRVVPLLSVDEIEQAEGGAGAAGGERAHSGGPAEPPVDESRPARRRFRRVLPRAAAAVFLLAAIGVTGVGTARTARAATVSKAPATITIVGTDAGSSVRLLATLIGADHKPLAKAEVQFLQFTTEFGPQGYLVPIGSATTDDSGAARLSYQSTVTGAQRFVVKYAGGSDAGPATASAVINVPVAHAAFRPGPGKPLAQAGKATVAVLVSIVLAVWLTLMVQVARVRRACRRAGDRLTGPPPPPVALASGLSEVGRP